MKFVKITIVVLVVVFVGIQLIPTKRNRGNTHSTSDFMAIFNVPKGVKSKMQTSCYDCHSNNTHYPWYSHVQPIAWFLENHIEEGKEALNFSGFGNYSTRRQKSKLRAIINQIEDNEMPLYSYTLIHRDAKLSKQDKAQLNSWLNTLRDTLK